MQIGNNVKRPELLRRAEVENMTVNTLLHVLHQHCEFFAKISSKNILKNCKTLHYKFYWTDLQNVYLIN